MKSLIVQLDHFTQQPIKKFNIHILPTLWNHIKDNLHHLSHSEVNLNDIGALDQLISELSNLDEGSTNFRYPNESPSQPPRIPKSLSMDNLKSVMTAIGNALTLVESAIDSEKAYWYAQDEDWSEEEESIIPWINYEFY